MDERRVKLVEDFCGVPFVPADVVGRSWPERAVHIAGGRAYWFLPLRDYTALLTGLHGAWLENDWPAYAEALDVLTDG